jgi:CO/xanthine dehydrogenase Mo-binding subunit
MKLRGTGFACVHLGTNYHFGMHDEAIVNLSVDRNGDLNIKTTAQELGQGVGTTLAMIVSEVFGGLHINRIHYHDANTDLPNSGYAAASRLTTIAGMAVLRAAEVLEPQLISLGSELLDSDPDHLLWREGKLIDLEDLEHSVTLGEIADEAERTGINLSAFGQFVAPETLPLNETTGQGYPINSISYATAVAEVEVDTETGMVRVLRLTSIHDSGKIINPEGAEAQVEGGLMMGLGFALKEEYVSEAGIPVTKGLVHYSIPSTLDLPELEVIFVEDSKGFGPFGAKGLGEVPMVVAAPAIINGIFDATKVRITDLPAKPERVLFALRDQGKAI